ncbi:hypothetical protein [Pedobacter xixiisoli]|nr:hypothetical protein [Pedobacter xixiisoli]
MIRKIIALTILTCLLNTLSIFAQDSLITALAKNNQTTFTKDVNQLKGLGWDKIIEKAKGSSNVLIGEDHFTDEIPFFVSKIAEQIKFDNFFCEIDPFTAHIFEQKINTLSTDALKKYKADYGNTFSFYAFESEFNLLKQLVNGKTNIRGTDQILLVADRLICNELMQSTKNKRAKEIYESIRDQSKAHFSAFLKDQKKPFYLLTEDFGKKIDELTKLKLSSEENKIVAALKLTAEIYKSQNHHLRIQLMKNQLMADYNNWVGKKNLYKYGANHASKGESMLEIYDIGNLVNNVADSQFTNSLHIVIVGKSGMQASPFQGFPASKIDENEGFLRSLKPFFKLINGNEWQCFDMAPIRRAIENGKIKITDIKLLRIIKGFDLLVVIPEVTASQFPKS